MGHGDTFPFNAFGMACRTYPKPLAFCPEALRSHSRSLLSWHGLEQRDTEPSEGRQATPAQPSL